MKKFIFLLFFAFSLPTWALTPIDVTTWGAVTAASANIIVDCDCVTTTNADGSQNVSIKSFRHIHKVGGQISCVVANPTQFFMGMANRPQSLAAAMLTGGGQLWISSDDGATWQSIVAVPGKLFPQITAATPDPWCLQQTIN
jgi:hypothetical protein